MVRVLAAGMLAFVASPVRASPPWDGIDREAVAILADLTGDESLTFHGIRVHDFERGGGDETRSVCGEVRFGGAPDFVRFVQLFGVADGRPHALGLPMVEDRTETATHLQALWKSFCRDPSKRPAGPLVAASSE